MAVPIFQRLRVGPVLGYLVAGVVIGPYGLRLIANDADIRHLAELGVVFLLFAIGLELKLSRLLVMRRLVFGLGSLQVLVTGAILAVIAWSVGVTPRPRLSPVPPWAFPRPPWCCRFSPSGAS